MIFLPTLLAHILFYKNSKSNRGTGASLQLVLDALAPGACMDTLERLLAWSPTASVTALLVAYLKAKVVEFWPTTETGALNIYPCVIHI